MSDSKTKREKLKPGKADQGLAMGDFLRPKSALETRRRHYCVICGKRFSERDMFWSDLHNGWLCGTCLPKIA